MTATAEQRAVLTTAREMIDALGGSAMTAMVLGIEHKHARILVNNWKTRGVPWHHRPKLARLLAESGYDVPTDFLERQTS